MLLNEVVCLLKALFKFLPILFGIIFLNLRLFYENFVARLRVLKHSDLIVKLAHFLHVLVTLLLEVYYLDLLLLNPVALLLLNDRVRDPRPAVR